MSALNKPGGVFGTPVDPASPSGILIDPFTEIGYAPNLDDVIKGNGLGGWTVGQPSWSGIVFKGTWDAATNMPALASGVGTQGDYYIVSVAGSTNLDGINNWTVGDWAIFNGTVWQKADNDTRPDYGALTADPTGIGTPPNGAKYYNTVLDMEMRYDATRAKWLSAVEGLIYFGRNGNVGPGAYYRGIDGLAFSATDGFPAYFNGTVVALGYTRADTDSATFEVVAGGAATGAELISTALSGHVSNLNSNFNQGVVLAVRNKAGGNTTTNGHGWVRVRWRA